MIFVNNCMASCVDYSMMGVDYEDCEFNVYYDDDQTQMQFQIQRRNINRN